MHRCAQAFQGTQDGSKLAAHTFKDNKTYQSQESETKIRKIGENKRHAATGQQIEPARVFSRDRTPTISTYLLSRTKVRPCTWKPLHMAMTWHATE